MTKATKKKQTKDAANITLENILNKIIISKTDKICHFPCSSLRPPIEYPNVLKGYSNNKFMSLLVATEGKTYIEIIENIYEALMGKKINVWDMNNKTRKLLYDNMHKYPHAMDVSYKVNENINHRPGSEIQHKILCDKLTNTINTRYNPQHIETNVEYELGECDVLVKTENREVYYEVKCNSHPESDKKAMKQLLRWTKYMHKRDSSKNYYGVYYSQQKTKLICKNGKLK